jgi:hypothetical protein
MWVLHLVLVPLVGIPLWRLLSRKLYRDAALFAAVSLAGYGLWLGIADHRPIILTRWFERIIGMWAGAP